jgi:hypothetical protein
MMGMGISRAWAALPLLGLLLGTAVAAAPPPP